MLPSGGSLSISDFGCIGPPRFLSKSAPLPGFRVEGFSLVGLGFRFFVLGFRVFRGFRGLWVVLRGLGFRV